MRQVILIIPDNKYHDFINHVRNSFSDIQIKEKDIDNNVVAEDENTYETTLLSESSLAEDWLSEDDNRWDEVL
jgi:TATA-binding protein-associated factor Taf7